MKRTIAIIISLIMCLSALVFTVPAGATEGVGKNLLEDATYEYVETNGFLGTCSDNSNTLLTDGKMRGNGAEFNDIYGVAGTTVELPGTSSISVIEFTLANTSYVNSLVFRSVRRNGNRYLNIVSIEVAGENGVYSQVDYSESSVAIEGAPKAKVSDTVEVDQYFDITATFDQTAIDVKKIRLSLNTYSPTDGYCYVVSFDELEAYGFSTGPYKAAGNIAFSGDNTVRPGATVTVNAYINEITAPNGFVACDLPLVYDTSLLQLVSVEPIVPASWGDAVVNLSPDNKSTVPYWLSLACVADDLLTNDDYYLTENNTLGFAITFAAIANGDAVITIDNDIERETFLKAVDAVGFKNYGVEGASHTVSVSGDPVQTYTVSYDANGGSGAPAAQTKIEGIDLTVSASVPVREGYTFMGWATDADAEAVEYVAGATYTDDADITLYAVWELGSVTVTTYTVSYDANGGENAPTAQIKTNNIPLFITSDEPTKEGYTFMGWATDADAEEVEYAAGATYTANADITLYAVWAWAGRDVLLGDANLDGNVDNLDAAYILRHDAALVVLSGDNLAAGDVNQDGLVDSLDAAQVLKFDAGIITTPFGTISVY